MPYIQTENLQTAQKMKYIILLSILIKLMRKCKTYSTSPFSSFRISTKSINLVMIRMWSNNIVSSKIHSIVVIMYQSRL